MLGILVISSCGVPEAPYVTKALPLRQLVNNTSIEKYERGSFFLVAGSYSKTEKEITKVKMFARVDGSYRLVEVDISEIRIHIDNNIKNPYIKIAVDQYSDMRRVKTDSEAVDATVVSYLLKGVHIYCSEELLPEKLLPIEL